MRTTYTGPVKNRGLNKRNQANVSREELEDFKRKHGQHLTLRDLLNAELPGGKTPPSEKAPLARGKQGANIEPSLVSASPARREAMDRASENARKREESKKASIARQEAAASQGVDRLKKVGDVAGLVMQGMMEGAERVPPGRGLGAMFIGGAGAGPRTAGMASKAVEAVKSAASKAGEAAKGAASKAGEAVKGAASKAGEAVKGAASKAGEAVKGAVERRGAHKAADDLVERPGPVGDLAPLPSPRVWRRGRDDAERVRLMEYMQRVADRGLKKGGSTKAYAKGGSVRGGGCETRTKKTRYV